MEAFFLCYILILFWLSFIFVKTNILISILHLEIIHLLLSTLILTTGVYIDDFDAVIFFVYALTIGGINTSIGISFLILYYRMSGILRLSYMYFNKT